MAEKDLNKDTTTTPELMADGSVIVRDASGKVTEVQGSNGKTYVSKTINAKPDAITVRRFEAYRWANEMTPSELVLAAITEYLDAHESNEA